MVRTGDVAPDFQGTTQDGQPIRLASFRGHPVILYFYPKASSSGCSLEARGFAEHYPEFKAVGTEVIGVSVDSVADQKRFSDECHLPFPLVADTDKAIGRSYGVIGLLGAAKRTTFFLDENGIVVEEVEGILPARHVERAVERAQSPAPPA